MPVALENLVAHYKLDDNAASTIVLDSSINVYNGTSIQNTNQMSTAGIIGKAFNFNGTTDYVEISQTFQSTWKNNWSVNFWFKAANNRTNNEQYLFSEGVDYIVSARITYDGHITAYYGTAGESFEVSLAQLPAGAAINWTMLTITATKVNTNTLIKLYRNGVFEQSSTIGFNMADFTSTTPLRLSISWNSGLPTEMYAGKIDDFSIYNKVLSVNEINQLYSEGVGNNIVDNDWTF